MGSKALSGANTWRQNIKQEFLLRCVVLFPSSETFATTTFLCVHDRSLVQAESQILLLTSQKYP